MNTKKDSPLKFGTMFKTQGYVSSTGLWGGGSGVTTGGFGRNWTQGGGFNPNIEPWMSNEERYNAMQRGGDGSGSSFYKAQQAYLAGNAKSTSAGSIGGTALMGAMGSIRNGESIRNRQANSIANVKKVAANNKRLVDKGLVAPGSKPDSRAPLLQLKNNNMEYNNINNKAFSNAGTIKNIMGESVPNTFARKVGNSPFKQAIDPMVAEGIDEPIAPPNRIATATAPPYDINNY